MKYFLNVNIEHYVLPPNVDIATNIGIRNANGPYILLANVWNILNILNE